MSSTTAPNISIDPARIGVHELAELVRAQSETIAQLKHENAWLKRQILRLWNAFHNKKNWLFCWSELGARHVGIIQSLIVTCRLQGIDPYTYLIDVLQRVSEHPAARVAELTPREWKTRFAAAHLRSDLQTLRS